MSIAYFIRRIRIKAVVGFSAQEIGVGSLWESGNLLFRTDSVGKGVQCREDRWAHGLDDNGRAYLIWRPGREPAPKQWVLQPLDSRYCYEVSPLDC
jgi:hypothetical protein